MSVRRWIPVLAAGLTLPFGASADERLRPLAEQVLEDAVYEVYSKTSGDDRIYPAGESYRRVVRRGAFLITIEQARLKIRIKGMVRDFDQDSSLTEDLAGRPVQFDYVDDAKRIFGKAVQGRLRVSKIEGEETVQAEKPLPFDMLTENGNVRKMLIEADKHKTEWTLKEFSPTSALEGHRTLKFTLLGREPFTFRGEKVNTFKFRQTDTALGRGPDVMFWVDRHAVLYRMEMEFEHEDGFTKSTVTFNRIR